MKTRLRTLLVFPRLSAFLLLILLSIAHAVADEVILDGVKYETNSDDNTASVTGHTDDLPADVVILSTINYDGRNIG